MSDEKIISAKNKKGTNAEHPEILPIENFCFEKIIKIFGPKEWKNIDINFNDWPDDVKEKNSKEIKSTFKQKLEMKNKIDWTIEEEYILFESRVALGGNHWSSIATFLRGRIANNVKNHFYSGLFVAIRSFKKNKLEISNFKERVRFFYYSLYLKEKFINLSKFYNKETNQYKTPQNIRLSKDEKDITNLIIQFKGCLDPLNKFINGVGNLIMKNDITENMINYFNNFSHKYQFIPAEILEFNCEVEKYIKFIRHVVKFNGFYNTIRLNEIDDEMKNPINIKKNIKMKLRSEIKKLIAFKKIKKIQKRKRYENELRVKRIYNKGINNNNIMDKFGKINNKNLDDLVIDNYNDKDNVNKKPKNKNKCGKCIKCKERIMNNTNINKKNIINNFANFKIPREPKWLKNKMEGNFISKNFENIIENDLRLNENEGNLNFRDSNIQDFGSRNNDNFDNNNSNNDNKNNIINRNNFWKNKNDIDNNNLNNYYKNLNNNNNNKYFSNNNNNNNHYKNINYSNNFNNIKKAKQEKNPDTISLDKIFEDFLNSKEYKDLNKNLNNEMNNFIDINLIKNKNSDLLKELYELEKESDSKNEQIKEEEKEKEEKIIELNRKMNLSYIRRMKRFRQKSLKTSQIFKPELKEKLRKKLIKLNNKENLNILVISKSSGDSSSKRLVINNINSNDNKNRQEFLKSFPTANKIILNSLNNSQIKAKENEKKSDLNNSNSNSTQKLKSKSESLDEEENILNTNCCFITEEMIEKLFKIKECDVLILVLEKIVLNNIIFHIFKKDNSNDNSELLAFEENERMEKLNFELNLKADLTNGNSFKSSKNSLDSKSISIKKSSEENENNLEKENLFDINNNYFKEKIIIDEKEKINICIINEKNNNDNFNKNNNINKINNKEKIEKEDEEFLGNIPDMDKKNTNSHREIDLELNGMENKGENINENNQIPKNLDNINNTNNKNSYLNYEVDPNTTENFLLGRKRISNSNSSYNSKELNKSLKDKQERNNFFNDFSMESNKKKNIIEIKFEANHNDNLIMKYKDIEDNQTNVNKLRSSSGLYASLSDSVNNINYNKINNINNINTFGVNLNNCKNEYKRSDDDNNLLIDNENIENQLNWNDRKNRYTGFVNDGGNLLEDFEINYNFNDNVNDNYSKINNDKVGENFKQSQETIKTVLGPISSKILNLNNISIPRKNSMNSKGKPIFLIEKVKKNSNNNNDHSNNNNYDLLNHNYDNENYYDSINDSKYQMNFIKSDNNSLGSFNQYDNGMDIKGFISSICNSKSGKNGFELNQENNNIIEINNNYDNIYNWNLYNNNNISINNYDNHNNKILNNDNFVNHNSDNYSNKENFSKKSQENFNEIILHSKKIKKSYSNSDSNNSFNDYYNDIDNYHFY